MDDKLIEVEKNGWIDGWMHHKLIEPKKNVIIDR